MQHHLLIGPPSSGKSTFAQKLQQHLPHSHIISTDQIRQHLYGDPSHQGCWADIFAQIQDQCHHSIAAGQTLIYDATNAKRPWRYRFLLPLLERYPDHLWIGWHLTTPLETCLQWNQQRDRQVPPDVIQDLHNALQTRSPLPAEGIATLQTLDPSQTPDLDAVLTTTLPKLQRRIINQRNATKHPQTSFHPYSSLLAFERLLHLIRLLIQQPGAGTLHQTQPDRLRDLLGATAADPDPIAPLTTDLDELSALLSQDDPLYGDRRALAQNLDWLQRNGFLSPEPSTSTWDLPEQPAPLTPTHSYSESPSFLRLMGILRFIAHHPFANGDGGTLETLTQAVLDRQLWTGSSTSCRDMVRKDIQRILKPYGLLGPHRYKTGYFFGTGIFSQPQLLQLHQLLAGQANSLADPTGLALYQTLTDRLQHSKLSPLQPYPVRALYNFTITNPSHLAPTALANTVTQLEQEIEQGDCLELQRFVGAARHGTEPESFFLAWPIQIVFQNIGWYLGYEVADGPKRGLLCFDRLDRLFRGRSVGRRRDRALQESACLQLQQLFQASGGLFLGDNPQQQRQWLSGKKAQRQEIQQVLELWFTDRAFRFVSEGDQRFPPDQIRFSPRLSSPPRSGNPKLFGLNPTGDPHYPHRCQLTLPPWAWKNVDLQRWIWGFEAGVRVMGPPEWVADFADRAQAIAALYPPSGAETPSVTITTKRR